jgi:hypothetical protein
LIIFSVFASVKGDAAWSGFDLDRPSVVVPEINGLSDEFKIVLHGVIVVGGGEPPV